MDSRHLPEKLAELPDKLARLLPRGGIAALTDSIEFMSLFRWARLSVVVGAVVGLAAAGVFWVLEWGESLLMEKLALFPTLDTRGLGKRILSSGGVLQWALIILTPALGGLAAGLVSWRFAPETEGAGVDNVLDAYHNRGGRMRKRTPTVKLITTLFTLGSGGSAGREGPMAQIGAGVGAYVADRFGLSKRERRLLLLAGAAGGVSALFRAPLGAALWSLEVLYRKDFESEGLFPCLVSSVTAYSVFTTIYEPGSLFFVSVRYHFQPTQLLFYGLMALVCAPFGLLWITLLRQARTRLWEPMRVPVWLKPALGGLALGIFCVFVPWVFSTGYGWMQDALRPIGDTSRNLPVGYQGFAMLLGLAVAKMIATSLTVSSGGSGGVFAPTLFIGGFIGGAFGQLFHVLAPGIVSQPSAFVLVGMGAFYAGVARTPIATIILISEMFGSYDLLVPLMFCEMITMRLLGRHTLYGQQVTDARHSPAHADEFTVDVLKDLKVSEHYAKGRAAATIPDNMNLRDFLEHVARAADSLSVVHDAKGALVGIVSLSNVRAVVSETEFLSFMLVTDAMWPLRTLAPDDDLRTALEVFLDSKYDHLPVVDPAEPRRVLGMLSQQQIFAAYNAELLRRRLQREGDSMPMRAPSKSDIQRASTRSDE
ncbi:chloride channel protein [Haliangium ochraceum]|uniref:Cl-channel voltage-gated family protein n=1 Tax=Haliangium ochraceum (strain DSM 14365 / JCM 11303 / SMP-2) TaxID=502025 RepID=D0LKI3_HALO1|nr:chloride channel protein [Haliangium ochraceum]ACY15031.1 Cl- channel voltage-gated family protein [Haliangium ochraceum DSM 14365]